MPRHQQTSTSIKNTRENMTSINELNKALVAKPRVTERYVIFQTENSKSLFWGSSVKQENTEKNQNPIRDI